MYKDNILHDNIFDFFVTQVIHIFIYFIDNNYYNIDTHNNTIRNICILNFYFDKCINNR